MIQDHEIRTANLAAAAFLQRNGFPILRFEKSHRGPGQVAVFNANAGALLDSFLDDLTDARRAFDRATAEAHEQAKRDLARTRPSERFSAAEEERFKEKNRQEIAARLGVQR